MIKVPQILFALALSFVFTTAILAQQPPLAEDAPPQVADRPGGDGYLRQLGVSQEQIRELRRLNRERRPHENAARKRFQAARDALDSAIYSDQVDDADFEIKLSEFHVAQAELASIRFRNELAIRRLLSPDQLVKFRELRRQFEERRQKERFRRQYGAPAPFREPPGGKRQPPPQRP